MSIARMLAKKFNLCGQTDLDHAKCDVIVDTLSDFQSAYRKKVYNGGMTADKDAAKKFHAEDASKLLENVEKMVAMYGDGNGHSVGKTLTWADLHVFDILGQGGWYSREEPMDKSLDKYLEKFPHITKVNKACESHPKIAEYLKKRPQSQY